jgi:MFS family permease
MGRIEWASAARILGWVAGLGLLVGSVIRLILSFELLGHPPEPPTDDFVDSTLTYYEFATSQWPIEFTSFAAFAIGFAALAMLGPVIGRLASEADARRGLIAVIFLVFGSLGLASQLLPIGALPYLTFPELCECGLREHEVMAREIVINTIFNVQLWMIVGALVLSVPGFVLAGSLGASAGMPNAWRWLSYLIPLASLVLAALAILQAFPFDQYVLGLEATILVPIWAAWLAMRAPEIWGMAAVEP